MISANLPSSETLSALTMLIGLAMFLVIFVYAERQHSSVRRAFKKIEEAERLIKEQERLYAELEARYEAMSATAAGYRKALIAKIRKEDGLDQVL